MGVVRGEVGDDLAGACDVALADVEQNQHGLLGQEAEAADALLVVVRQFDIANWLSLVQGRNDLLQYGELAIVRLALGGSAVVALNLEPLDALLDNRKIGEDEFEVQTLDIATRINRLVRMWHGRVLERANDVQQ